MVVLRCSGRAVRVAGFWTTGEAAQATTSQGRVIRPSGAVSGVEEGRSAVAPSDEVILLPPPRVRNRRVEIASRSPVTGDAYP